MVAHRQASRRCLALDTLAPRAFIGNVPSPTLGCLVSPWSDLATPHFPSFPASCTRTVNVGASPPVSGHACQSNTQVPLAWGERRAGEKLPKRFYRRFSFRTYRSSFFPPYTLGLEWMEHACLTPAGIRTALDKSFQSPIRKRHPIHIISFFLTHENQLLPDISPAPLTFCHPPALFAL